MNRTILLLWCSLLKLIVNYNSEFISEIVPRTCLCVCSTPASLSSPKYIHKVDITRRHWLTVNAEHTTLADIVRKNEPSKKAQAHSFHLFLAVFTNFRLLSWLVQRNESTYLYAILNELFSWFTLYSTQRNIELLLQSFYVSLQNMKAMHFFIFQSEGNEYP